MMRRPPRATLFPTRRSSDLSTCMREASSCARRRLILYSALSGALWTAVVKYVTAASQSDRCTAAWPRRNARERSEEHTSELQSRQYLVCRLLLEKKKKTQ